MSEYDEFSTDQWWFKEIDCALTSGLPDQQRAVYVVKNMIKQFGEIKNSKAELDDLSKRFTALIQQNSALAADNERLADQAEWLQTILEEQKLDADERLMLDLHNYALGLKKEGDPVGILEEHEDGGVFFAPTVNLNNLPVGIQFYLSNAESEQLKQQNEHLSEQLIRACAELSGIKKQEPVAAYYTHKNSAYVPMYWNEKGIETSHKEAQKIGTKATLLYKYPVHQHSFTISGIGTFYADSEVCITYLERLHGVGGKANLKAVDDINHRANEFGKRFSDAAPVCLSCGRYKQDLNRIDEMHRNIHEVKRAGDQTVTVTFSSCRTASVFEKHINEEKERAK